MRHYALENNFKLAFSHKLSMGESVLLALHLAINILSPQDES